MELPYRKRRRGELSADEKDYNGCLGSFRVAIEHRIGQTKRFRNPRHTHPTKTYIIAGLVIIEAGFSLFRTLGDSR